MLSPRRLSKRTVIEGSFGSIFHDLLGAQNILNAFRKFQDPKVSCIIHVDLRMLCFSWMDEAIVGSLAWHMSARIFPRGAVLLG